MRKEIEIPSKCPSCKHPLERVKDQLFCRFIGCTSKKQKQVENYTKVLKIKGLGQQTVKKLELSDIQDIYNMTSEYIEGKVGKKMATKIVMEIEKSKNISLGLFLSACSIPLIGATAGKKVAVLTNNPLKINKKLCKEAGLGDKATSNLVDWLENVYSLMSLPITFTEIHQPTKKYLKVCITGKITKHTKDTLTEFLNSKGVEVVAGVSSKINYLICDYPKGSAKERKATELNIPIHTLEEFMEILKNE